jgi:hypothetical protein
MRVRKSIVVALALVAVAGATPIQSKPSNVPVSLEYSVPEGLRTGDEVTTAIGFRALADIDRLDVQVNPFRGVEIVSGQRQATFANVRKGSAPQVEVRVRLTDPKVGSIGVTYKTTVAGKSAADAINIAYGDTSN